MNRDIRCVRRSRFEAAGGHRPRSLRTARWRLGVLSVTIGLLGTSTSRGQTQVPAPQHGFYTLTPCRVVDTRNATGPWGGPALVANADRIFTLAGRCGIPSTAESVAVNIAVVGATSAGDLRVYPAGYPLPMSSAINYSAGQVRANNGRYGLSADGKLAVRCDQVGGSVHLLIDVSGYYETAAAPPPPTPTPTPPPPPTPPPGGSLWSKRFGDVDDDRAHAVAVDGSGRIAVTGSLDGTTNFGGGNVTSYVHPSTGPTVDVFVAEYSSTGGYLWARVIGAEGADQGKGVSTDSNGNVAITGVQGSYQVDYGGGAQAVQAGTDVFVAKYSSSGGWVWSKTVGGYGNDLGNAVAYAPGGDVVLTGAMDVSSIGVNFGGGALYSAGGTDAFLVKYAGANGAHVWSKRMGGTSIDLGSAVAVDAAGNIYAAGSFGGTVDFGGAGLTSSGARDVYLVKYTSAGGLVWAKRFGGTSDDFVNGIAVDGAGDVVIAGRFQGTINFGGGNLASAGGEDAYMAKLSGASGGHVWSKRFGGTSNDNAGGVDTDGSGNVVVTGYYNGSVDFGGGALTSNTVDVFAAKYAPTGGHIWSRKYGDFNYQFGTSVAVTGSGEVTLAGYFTNVVNLGSGVLTSASSNTNDAYLARVAP